MNIAIIVKLEKDFDEFVFELVAEQGFANDTNFVWVKDKENIPDGILFDHVLVVDEKLSNLKSQIPLKNEKFKTISGSEETQNGPTEDSGTSDELREQPSKNVLPSRSKRSNKQVRVRENARTSKRPK